MANPIESLHFEVILDTKKFDERVEATKEAAREFNKNMSSILNIQQKASSTSKATSEAQKQVTAEVKKTAAVSKDWEAAQKRIAENLEKEKNQISQVTANSQLRERAAKKVAENEEKVVAVTKEATKQQKEHTKEMQRAQTSATNLRSVMSTISQLTGVYFGAMGIRRFLSSMIEITGQFEVQRMALRNMLQDVDAADKIFQDLYRFSSDSTYRFSELAKYAKQLAAFNIEAKDLLETTKMLGDVASGVGVSMDRIILAYGHVKSSGFLRGIQLRSFSQNGVPVLDELAKMFSELEHRAVSLGEVFDKMTKREIPFEMVEQAFRNMTSEGGKFYKMQEVLAKTLAGQINILKGRWENMLAAIGESQDSALKGAVAKLNDLVLNYEKLGGILKEAILVWGAYRAAVVLTTLATQGLSAATSVGLLGAMKNLLKWIAANPWALLAAGVTLLTVEIVKATQALDDEQKILKALSDVSDKYNKSLEAEIGELDALFAAVKNATYGTKEYDAAKRALESRFDPYIQKLREEGVAVDNLTDLYDGLVQKITEANKQRFLENAQKDLLDTYNTVTDGIEEDFKKLVQEHGHLTADQIGSLRHYMYTGVKNSIYETIPGLGEGVRRSMALAGGGSISWKDDKSVQTRLDRLMERATGAASVYAQGLSDAEKMFATAVDSISGQADDDLGQMEYKISSIVDGIKNLDKEIEKIRKKARSGSITQSEKDRLDELIKDRDAQAKEYEDIMGVKYDKDQRGVAKGESAAEKAVRESIAKTKADISLLEKFKSAYDKLEPVFGEDAARAWVFNKMGYDISNLDTELEALIAHLRTLGDEGNEAADAIEARFGLDEASKAVKEYNAEQKALEKRQKALEAYKKAMDKFDKDWGDGESRGAAYDIEKAVRDYHNEEKKIDKEYLEAQMAIFEAHQDNVDVIKEETDRLEKLNKDRKNANKNKHVETVRSRAEKIFKEQLQGFDLTNWNDKTLSQINAIREAIQKVEIPPEILEDLEGDTEAAEALAKALFQLKKDTIENTVDPERFKKIAKEAKRIAGYLGDAANKMREFAEATGNTKLGDAAEIVGMLAQNIQAAAEGAEAWGGWWGAIIGGLTDLFNQVTSGFTDAMNASKQLASTLREIQTEAWILSNTSMFSNDGIFGTNSAANLRGASKAMEQLRDDMKSIGDPKIERSARTIWEKISVGWRKIFNPNHVGLTEEGYQGTLAETMRKYGLNVYDQYGNFDAASIRQVIKLFGDEDGALERLAKDSEAYAEAMKTVENTMEDLFGDIASSLADQIVDTWWEAGEAALDYADILGDVAKAYAKMIVQDTILDSVFNDEKKEALKQAFVSGDASKAMAIVAQAMQEAEDMLPAVESALSAFEPYRNMNTGDEANSVGNGFKSITEDTANLLASYMNAIRADVSVIRGAIEGRMDGEESLTTGIPTLNEHLAQIAATNFDIAQSNQAILSEIRSVIGAPGTSGMVVRVEAY